MMTMMNNKIVAMKMKMKTMKKKNNNKSKNLINLETKIFNYNMEKKTFLIEILILFFLYVNY